MPQQAFVPWAFAAVLLTYVLLMSMTAPNGPSPGQLKILGVLLPLICAAFIAGCAGYITVGGKVAGLGLEAGGAAAIFYLVFRSLKHWR